MSKPARAAPASPSTTTAPTAAREALADALSALRDAERSAAAARAPVARLEAEIAGEAAARAALAELDAAYAARMADWAAAGKGPAPEPDLEARRQAEGALASASAKAEAARGALAALRQGIAEADRRLGDANGLIEPAVAAVLREDGAWIAAEYWRRYADLEHVRRELAALDQVLMTDFPIAHAPTGRTIVNWISPDKLSAPDTLAAADAACAGLDGVQEFARYWRAKAEDLTR